MNIDFVGRRQAVLARIRAAEQRFQRPSGAVRLLAVSKIQPTAAMIALAAAGQCCFGENYVQEALDKIAELAALRLEWHLIGPLQANKTRTVAENFAWVHSVDRLKIAERLNAQRPADLPPLNVCLQVNIDREPAKHGLDLGAVATVAQAVAELPHLRLRGLMAIPAPAADFAAQRRPGPVAGVAGIIECRRTGAGYALNGDVRRFGSRHCRGRDPGANRDRPVRATRLSGGFAVC